MRILALPRRKLLVRAVFGVAVVLLSSFLVRADAATTTTSHDILRSSFITVRSPSHENCWDAIWLTR